MGDQPSIEKAHDSCFPEPSGPAWSVAIGQGMDMSLVELSLEKAPWQRLLEHDAALRLAEELREAGRNRYAGP